MKKTVLVIGSGAREHALSYTLLQGPATDHVLCAPGNPGMALDGIVTCPLNIDDHAAVIDCVRSHGVDWVFIGPEQPLMNGIVDDLTQAGIPVFGPTKAAAQIEGSKDFAKALMGRHGIPTADYRTFTSLDKASEYVRSHGAPIVVKADGLAAGKGVTVAQSVDEAMTALKDIFVHHRFGAAGAKVVIEDFLEGQEFSMMSFVRGHEVWPMPISQDHKRAYDGDKGPNTGGMGAYSPVPQIDEETLKQAMDSIIRPMAQAMVDEALPFTGVLYAGLIATSQGPKVIEFNARLGDPETEVVLPLLQSDLGLDISTILEGGQPKFDWNPQAACLGVVVACKGYPDHTAIGADIPAIPMMDGMHTFYAGVEQSDAALSASSGRAMLVESIASDLTQAKTQVYRALDTIDSKGLFYRHDIGLRALSR